MKKEIFDLKATIKENDKKYKKELSAKDRDKV